MLLKCVVYENGRKTAEIAASDIHSYVCRPGCFVWVAMRDRDIALLEEMREQFDLHPLASGFLSELLARAVRERTIVLEVSPAGGRDYIHPDDAIAGLLAIDSTTGSAVDHILSWGSSFRTN